MTLARASALNESGARLLNEELGSLRDNIEQAIAAFEHALEELEGDLPAHIAGRILANLGIAYAMRIAGDPVKNSDCAIAYLQAALTAVSGHGQDPDVLAPRVVTELGTAYLERPGGNAAANIEDAIKILEPALPDLSRALHPKERGLALNSLGLAYTRRPLEEHAANLEQALEYLEEAVQIFDAQQEWEWLADAQHNLGLAHLDRLRGGYGENLEKAITCFRESRDATPAEEHPLRWALAEMHVGLAEARRTDNRTENLGKAIAHMTRALAKLSRENSPAHWARALYGRTSAQADLAEATGDRSAYPQICAGYREAQSILNEESFPLEWAAIENALGLAHAAEGGAENADLAESCFRRVLEKLDSDTEPRETQRALRNLGDLYIARGHWDAAERTYAQAIDIGEQIVGVAYTDAGRREEMAVASRVYADSAYALLQLGRREEGLVCLEQGKARLLGEALALRDADLGGVPNDVALAFSAARKRVRELEGELALDPGIPGGRRPDELGRLIRAAQAELREVIANAGAEGHDLVPSGLAAKQILELTAGRALVLPLVSAAGGACLIVPWEATGPQDIEEIRLPGLSSDVLGDLLADWSSTYRATRRDDAPELLSRWHDEIDTCLGRLWDVLMGPVDEALRTRGRDGAEEVVVLPQGGLGLLPLHAARREKHGSEGYFLDDWTVGYAPSAYALAASQRRAASLGHTRSLLAAIDPTLDLPFASFEGTRIELHFQTAHMLPGAKATQEAVLADAARATHLHFACHAFYAFRDALDSALVLAGRVPLEMKTILTSVALPGTRLVSLSACETGITSLEDADEFTGLPSAFVQAGAVAVVATLWAVNDLSTSLLMDRFFLHHASEGAPPAIAMRKAQRWLRHAPASELGLAPLWQALADSGKLADEPAERAREKARFFEANPSDRPFEHPFHWAGFTVTGC